MAVQNPTVIKTYFQTGDKPTQAQFADFIDSAIPALVYRALLSQAGVGAPTVVVLENTLGEVPTFVYQDVGKYQMNTVGNVFIANKTWCVPGNDANEPTDEAKLFSIKRISDTEIRIISRSQDSGTFQFVGVNGTLDGTPILILVYP